MSLELKKAMPGLVIKADEHDNRMGMFEESNAYNPDAPGISGKLAKGKDPFASINLDPNADAQLPFGKSGAGSRGGKVIGKTSSGKPIYDSASHHSHSSFNAKDHSDAANLHSKMMNDKYKASGEAAPSEAHHKEMEAHAKKAGPDHKPAFSNFRPTPKDWNDGFKSVGNALDDLIKADDGDDEEPAEDPDPAATEAKKEEDEGNPPEKKDPPDFGKSGAGSRGGKVIGKTRSGKPIYDSHDHKGHAGFSKDDHKDAAKLHDDLGFKAAVAKNPKLNVEHSNHSYQHDKAASLMKSEEEGDVSTNGEDPKLKRHKRQFDKMRKLHENMDPKTKKAMRGERVAARLKKCMVDEIKAVIKSYGSENLINTHGERFMSEADKEVLNYVRTIDRIDLDLCPTHNPPVPRSYASHKSMTTDQNKIFIAQKAFD
jgi:hypothetical protein